MKLFLFLSQNSIWIKVLKGTMSNRPFLCLFLNCTKRKQPHICVAVSFLVTRTGIERLLRLRLAYYTLGINASRLLAKNNSPNCFLNAKTLSGSIPFSMNRAKRKKSTRCVLFFFLVTRTGIEPVLPP